MISSVLFHELGHLAAALLQKRRITGVFVDAGGVRLCVDTLRFSYLQDAVLHLCGPLFNFFMACVYLLLIRAHPTELLFFGFYFNFLLFVFHLLPISALDGGAALYALYCRRLDPDRAHRRAANLSRAVCLGCLLLLAVVLVRVGFHASLLFGILFFLGGLSRRKKVPAL